jgi:hypothetical protein
MCCSDTRLAWLGAGGIAGVFGFGIRLFAFERAF